MLLEIFEMRMILAQNAGLLETKRFTQVCLKKTKRCTLTQPLTRQLQTLGWRVRATCCKHFRRVPQSGTARLPRA